MAQAGAWWDRGRKRARRWGALIERLGRHVSGYDLSMPDSAPDIPPETAPDSAPDTRRTAPVDSLLALAIGHVNAGRREQARAVCALAQSTHPAHPAVSARCPSAPVLSPRP